MPGLTRRNAVLAGVGLSFLAAGYQWGRLTGRKERPWADVRDFGARGDGLHDAAAAIQEAIESGAAEIRFPAGSYKIGRALHPRSHQTWRGDGPERTHLVYGGPANQPPFNLLHSTDDLNDLAIIDMGFRGGRVGHLAPSPDGQGGFALYLRGDVRSLRLDRCHFTSFGDGAGGGGGVVLGPLPGVPRPGPLRVHVEGCVFEDNGNVPGIYIQGGDRAEGREAGMIRIRGNVFAGVVGATKIQNTIYVLGGGERASVKGVEISHNQFHFSQPVDAAIELNWVEGFSVTGNILDFKTAIPGTTGILVRDGCNSGTIASNSLTSSVSEGGLRGIVLVNFAHPATIANVAVTGNSLTGLAKAIGVDRGSVGVVVVGNRIEGRGGRQGIWINDARDVLASGNLISSMAHGMTIGHGDLPTSSTSGVTIEGNRFNGCGSVGGAVIRAALPEDRASLDDLVIRGNTAGDMPPGVTGLIDPILASLPGSRIDGNIPAGPVP